MNKADIDEMIKWFATYCNEPLKFGAYHEVENTGMVVEYRIEIKKSKLNNKGEKE